jgi:hypothetical protein
MHFHFSAQDILWTLAFASELVLLVVLMGRDRIARFPWFTAAAVMMALRLLTAKLLNGRLPQMTMAVIFIVMAEVGALIGLLLVIEIARRAFGSVRRSTWLIWAVSLLLLGGVILKYWGPWPSWKTLTAHSTTSALQLVQLLAQKTSLLVDIENIAVGLLILLFGRRYGAGWRSHTQQIAIGLSTASLTQLSIGILWERIAHSAQPKTMAEYQQLIGVRDKLFNVNSAVFVVVVVWWIVCLWRDEPGTAKAGTPAQPAALAEGAEPDAPKAAPAEGS